MKTPATINHSEYRALFINGLYEVWLVSFATGSKLKKVSNPFGKQIDALNFIEWLKERETKNQ